MDIQALKYYNEIVLDLKNDILGKEEFEAMFIRFYEIMKNNNHDFVEIDRDLLKQSYAHEVSLTLIITELVKFHAKQVQVKINFNNIINCYDIEKLFTWVKLTDCHKEKITRLKVEFKCFENILDLFEILQLKENKKLFGQYYTPDEIVALSINNLKFSDKLNITTTVVDPACGSGAFLKKIVALVVKKFIKIEDVCFFINENLYGYDINPFAIFLCKITLLLFLIDSYNSYEEIDYITRKLKFSNIRNINTITTDSISSFDYIIGNPPYFKIKNETIKIKKEFREVLHGQGNIYSLFVLWSIFNAKEGGEISLVLPQSFRSGKYFQILRSEISKWQVKSIVCVDAKNRKGLFVGAEQAVLILHLKKSLSRNNRTKILYTYDGNEQSLLGKFPQKEIMTCESVNIPTSVSAHELYKRLYKDFRRFREEEKELVFGNGLFVWNQNKDKLSNACNEAVPIIYANYITKTGFKFTPNKNYNEDIGGRKPYCLLSPKLDNFLCSGPKLIIKRTSGIEKFHRINSCLIDNDFVEKHKFYFIENHINMLYVRGDKHKDIPTDSLLYIQAFLNSDIINFIFKQFNGNTQVSALELNNLPYIRKNEEEIVELMRAEVKDYNKINEIFYKNFKITQEEINVINEYKER